MVKRKRRSSNRSLESIGQQFERDMNRHGDKADKNTSGAVDDLCKTTRIKKSSFKDII